MRHHRRKRRRERFRKGTTAVEVAVTLPIYFVILLTLFEFGHAFMTIELLKATARTAARTGVPEGRTTADVLNKVNAMLSSNMNPATATVYVKDGSDFDAESPSPPGNYASLADVEVANLGPRQLFIVRIEVPYNQISMLPSGWLTEGVVLSGQSVTRHE